MMQLHSSMSLPRQQQISATTSQSTTKLQVYVGGMIVCPNLGIHFPRGDNHKGRIITQEKAASLPFFRRNQVPSLLYDANMNGFHPKNWRFHVSREKDQCLFLLPLDEDGDNCSNMVHVHRSRNQDENLFLYSSTSKFIDECNAVRRTNGWKGKGKMVEIGDHIDMKGNHCNFVIRPEFRNQWSCKAEKITLLKCGEIFQRHFFQINQLV